jgi:transposase
MRMAIVAGTHSLWASRVLEECSHEILVANSRKLRLIYSNKHKTDEIDAENLARLARLDPKLLYPLKHRGEDSQAQMALIRSRQALISCRTQLVNHLTMHRATEERGLKESANGSTAKDAEPLRSIAKGAAKSALTNSAFSWKFAHSLEKWHYEPRWEGLTR